LEFLASPAAFFGKEDQFNAAVLGAFESLLTSEASTIAVFSHGTPINALV
jgi:broad specificity phosphatase PhoE